MKRVRVDVWIDGDADLELMLTLFQTARAYCDSHGIQWYDLTASVDGLTQSAYTLRMGTTEEVHDNKKSVRRTTASTEVTVRWHGADWDGLPKDFRNEIRGLMDQICDRMNEGG